MAFHFAREGLLESQKLTDNNSQERKLPESQITPIEIPKDNAATAISKPAKMSNSDDNPLHILQIRFAKGEISKEEYEEMRKIIES